jgi:hypothetical protein
MRYAKGDIQGLIKDVKHFDKFVAIVCSVPLGGFIALGESFFQLWMPTQDAQLLQNLSVITCITMIVVNGVQPLGIIFTVYNRVKPQAIAWIIQGFSNIVLVYLTLKLTNLGVYAIVGISSVLSILRQFLYTVPLATKYLNLKWYVFLPDLVYSLLCCGIVAVIGFIVNIFITPSSWIKLFIVALITAIISLGIHFIIILNNGEKQYIFKLIKKLKR